MKNEEILTGVRKDSIRKMVNGAHNFMCEKPDLLCQLMDLERRDDLRTRISVIAGHAMGEMVYRTGVMCGEESVHKQYIILQEMYEMLLTGTAPREVCERFRRRYLPLEEDEVI